MKKATTKRERKYGKKNKEGVVTHNPVKKEQPVRLMVDGFSILKFKSRSEAESFINKKEKEALDKRQKPTSYVFID